MKRKTVAAILLFVILLTAVPAFADGQFRIITVETKENGNVLIRWNDPANNGPYLVLYEYMSGDEHFSLQLVERDVQQKEIEITDLVPGEKYCLIVADKNYQTAEKEYSSKTQLFGGKGSTARLTVTLRQKKKGSLSSVDRFRVSDIEKTLSGGNDFCGATIKATMPTLLKETHGTVRVAIKQPNGDMFVFMVREEKLLPSYEYIYYDSMPLTQIWRYIKQQNDDSIPTGTYTISFYYNTDYFGHQDFVVVQ